ncbi:MAG: hypothetical protein JWM16_6320 [Verrucomicrobiales bacterium]|nr:hypothetical protein [Verrucomicrobiales bacterium]
MSGPYEAFEDMEDEDCPNCGGEGVTYSCIDGCCEDADEGCDLCARRCDWCSPWPSPKDDGLRQVLAEALDAIKVKP